MADAIPPIKVSIVADTSGLKTGLDQATTGIKKMEDSVKTASSGMSKFVTQIKQVGATLGVAFAGQQVLQFGKDVILASSNMAESLSKVQVVFGENSAAVEKWASKSAGAMGLSSQAALEAAGTYGNLFQAFGLGQPEAQKMSTSLVQLASDMASFNNTSIDEAITALRSGLSGETEPLKRFGVAMNEARLKEEAMSMGLIKSTKEALTPAAKAQAAYALIMNDTKLAQGDYARTADGTANTMRTLKAEFDNAKVALGDALMPAFRAVLGILKLLVPVLKAVGEFFKKYNEDIMLVAKVVMIAVGAWYAYKAALVVTAVASEVMAVAQTLLKGQQLASIASTNGLAASMLVLNAVMKANPIGLIVTGITLAVAAIALLWKHSDGFRNAVISMAKVAVLAFASIIPMVGKVFEAIMKITTGPLKLLLTALSHLPGVGKYAKAGLDIMNKGLNSISDFADSASKKAKELAASLDKMGKEADKAGKKAKEATKDTPGGGGGGGKGGGGLTADQKAKLDKYVSQAKAVQKDMQDAIDAANEKALEALNTRNEKMADANQTYLEREADLRKNYAETMAEAQKNYDEKVFDINKTYDEKELDLLKTKNSKIADLQAKAEEQNTKLIQAAADKRQSIIQQSIDRLRNAFASKTGFSIADAFGAGATTGKSLLEKIRTQLTGAKELQANAGRLAAAGYSQTFIEQIVSQGPEIGNQIAKALQESTPEEVAALKASFIEMEKMQNSGLDALAASMNSGARLATDELRKAYDQVAVDLKDALTVVDEELKKSMAEANANYQDAMAQTKKDRNEALADALKTFTEAKAKAQKTLDEGLADAQKALQDALTKAQKEYENAIDEINKATQKKLEELQAKLKAILALIAAISAATASLTAAQTPVYAPVVAYPDPSKIDALSGLSPEQLQLERNRESGKFQININANTNVSAKTIADTTASAIKYGTYVRIGGGGRGTALID